MHGKYCSKCGQHVILPEDKKLSHLLSEFFHHFTHLDGKFLVTLRSILFKPGKVTRDISMGITIPHFKLSALFLIGTIIYYLVPSNVIISTPANISFSKQVNESEFREWKKTFAINKTRKSNMSLLALEARYDTRQHDYGKLLTLLLIPLLIPVLWVISKIIKKFNPDNSFTAYDLGIASLEINSIILYGLYLIGGMVVWIGTSIYPSEKVSLAGFILFFSALLVMLFFFFKRAYQIKWWQAFICLTLIVIANVYILQLHGLICFLIFV